MSALEKGLAWGPPAEEFPAHPVKKLCMRATSPPEEASPKPSPHPAPLSLDLNEAATTETVAGLSLDCVGEALNDVATEFPSSWEEAPEGYASNFTEAPAAMAATAAPSLECLGEDLLLHVLRLAQPTAWDLCRMACVSRAWRDACYNPFFWTKLRVGPGSMRAGVEQLAARCGQLAELHISDPQCELHVLHPIVVACGPSLRRVSLTCPSPARSALPEAEASICSLLWLLSLHCKNVHTLELLPPPASPEDHVPAADFGFLEAKALWFLTTGFRHVRTFASLATDSITKHSLYLIVIAWRQLVCLRIHAGRLARHDLAALRKCPALRALELAHGDLGDLIGPPGDAAQKIIHPRMEIVVLTSTICEAQDIVALMQVCPGLKRVLVSRDSWAHGESVLKMAQRRCQLKKLQIWMKAVRGIDLLVED